MHQSYLLYRIAFSLLLVLPFTICFSQQDTSKHYLIVETKELSLLTALNVGKYTSGEIGIGINEFGQSGPQLNGLCYYFSNEIKLGDKFLMGPKIGIHLIGGLALGISLIYYTNLDSSSLVFRPDIGIGYQRFKMAYGYNVKISNKDFQGISTHLFTIMYLFRLKHLGEIRR